jgi:dTDP-4-amino-4,6-dideoxygalactose transaminase
MIPVLQPVVDVGTVKHLMDAFHVGWLGMGATTKEFEERISGYLGLDYRYAVAAGSRQAFISLLVISMSTSLSAGAGT